MTYVLVVALLVLVLAPVVSYALNAMLMTAGKRLVRLMRHRWA
jgi:hypothetical protein